MSEADKKIKFSEYLMDRNPISQVLPAVRNHIMAAINLTIKDVCNLDDRDLTSPRLTMQALEKIKDEEAREFVKSYVTIWQTLSKPNTTDYEIKQVLASVKKFVEWSKTRTPEEPPIKASDLLKEY